MTLRYDRKPWTERDIKSLKLGYDLGANIKTLSLVLDRSESALTKALSRLGIRQYGLVKRGRKSKGSRKLSITSEHLRLEITKAIGSSQGENLSQRVSHQTKKAKKHAVDKSYLSFPLRRRALSTPLWLDLNYAVSLLRQYGHKVYENVDYTSSPLYKDATFFLDDIPVSSSRILMQANRIRLERGLEPFYIENITEY